MNHTRGFKFTLNLSIIVALLVLSVQFSYGSVSPLKRTRDGTKVGETDEAVRLPKVLDFKEYVMKFNKAYSTTEWMSKANLFLARAINIFRHNAKYLQKKYSYYLGLNEFTDISAKEFESMSSRGDPALEAVHDINHYPQNMPANELPSVQKISGREGLSMSASGADEQSTVEYEALYGDDKAPNEEILVDFSDDAHEIENVNITQFYREFISSVAPEEAEQVSKVLELSKRKDRRQQSVNADPKSERAMIRHKVEYRPVVKKTNKNYDEMHVISHGVYDNLQAGRAFSDKMALFLDYDVDILDGLKPYEPPVKKTRTKAEQTGSGSSSSYFSSFFSTAKDLAKSMASNLLLDSLFIDEGDIDEYLLKNAPTNADEDKDEKTTSIEQQTKELSDHDRKKIKYKVDWRLTGCISRPKSQSGCNSCYAFTVIALMEYYHCRQTRKLTEFSAQYIVDCGKRTKLNGCKGGHLGLVGKFISLHGLELQAMYPYSGVDGNCPYAPDETQKMGYLRPKILNWIYVKKMSDWYEHIRKGPLLVGIAMPSDFLAYAGGIHDGLDCNPDKVHAMLLVGSGYQGGKEFWLFKNSFSSDWGENGYFRLAKDAPLKCFNSGVVVRVDFNAKRES